MEASELGITLPHEHIYLDLSRVFPPHTEYMLNDVELACEELSLFAKVGGRTVLEVTTPDIGRSPARLVEIARRTGINVVMGTGRYHELAYGPDVFRRSVSEIADELVTEIEKGVEGVKAGILGEIGVSSDYVSPAEERVHRAAARAHVRTGVSITTHAVGSPVGLDQLDIFAEEGVDLRRVAIGHCDRYPYLSYHEAILRRGAFVQFDAIRGAWAAETRRQASQIGDLIAQGYMDKILISQDVCSKQHYAGCGGCGYAYVVEGFRPVLAEAGVSGSQLEAILIDNPLRLLGGYD